MKNKKGFTLAEVLITLGIIGVVAAITMPTVINKVNDKVFENQSKKAQTIIANGIKLLMANEDVTSIENSSLSQCSTQQCVSDTLHKAFKIVGDVPVDKTDKQNEYKFSNGNFPIWTDSNMYYSFVTPDGMFIGIKKFTTGASGFTFVADLNGKKNPNTGAKDLCKYTVTSTGTLIDSCSSMAACGGTAYNNPPKLYSWGMQSADAALYRIKTAPDDSTCATLYGDGAYSATSNSSGMSSGMASEMIDYNNLKCPDGYDKTTMEEYSGACCVPKKSTSCF